MRTLKAFGKAVRDASIWRSQNARLLAQQLRRRGRSAPGEASTDQTHLRDCLGWLERAQDAVGNGGFAGRYRLTGGWSSAYPETTGYIIPTLLDHADALNAPRLRERARKAVDFLFSVQLTSGAFPGGEIDENRTRPSVFNTGQIICGLVAWHAATRDSRALEAAERAGDWMGSVQDADGAWRRHVYDDVVTTYTAHASCWVAQLGAHTGKQTYLDVASRHLDWLLAQVQPDTGWVRYCGFSTEDHAAERAVTHTIAYTLWGLLLSGEILHRPDAIEAASRGADAVARQLERLGWLPGVLDSQWRPASTYACLTGNAQMALIWMRLYELGADRRFLNAAVAALELVKQAQPYSADPGISGGIPGSDPVWGGYIRLALPNWSAKFFLDALSVKHRLMGAATGDRVQ